MTILAVLDLTTVVQHRVKIGVQSSLILFFFAAFVWSTQPILVVTAFVVTVFVAGAVVVGRSSPGH